MGPITQYLQKNNFIPQIINHPNPQVGIIIIIPCFNEPDLISSLDSLWNCERPSCQTEVIIVINEPENASLEIQEQNQKTLKDTQQWIEWHSDGTMFFYPFFVTLTPKHAGVGFARKTGMDEAAHRYNLINKENGIIVGFDADSKCKPNYLTEIENHFNKNSKTPGASIYFEHPLFDTLNNEDLGIIYYELHLRYLNQCLRYTGHPHAFQTVGSSFAVKCISYVKQGGMNRRQAGEDFYFIQKIIALGNYTEINTTCVIPSSRESDRVPFGTGAAIKKWKTSEDNIYFTYSYEAFTALKLFFQLTDDFFNNSLKKFPEIISVLPSPLTEFLTANKYTDEIELIKKHTASPDSFRNRFFNWFNIFKCIRYLNITHETHYKMENVVKMSKLLLKSIEIPFPENIENMDLLTLFRKIEKGDSLNH